MVKTAKESDVETENEGTLKSHNKTNRQMRSPS